MAKRLRLLHYAVQPIAVYDDDETGELTPGPSLGVMTLSSSQVDELLRSMPNQLKDMEEQLSSEENSDSSA
jgi:hypothetical protein